ncbi:hypothetical protein [Anaeromyxobacter dehalogenans]|uniref:Uncharacterized protein n=1 Tax=Anaeromyxobacter dehalogenans (strain 2CP-C) TaxID=290397 RepID=Q2IKC0_ANADE|nr:hypothetical protein [Anaeromyxobacter dehalogenans]ABC82104.1 hypothetical protein Adeh_2334 [Anaeromyxobacter dehalogenans 2CP-C]
MTRDELRAATARRFPVRLPFPEALHSTDARISPGARLLRYVADVLDEERLHPDDVMLARADYHRLMREVARWLRRRGVRRADLLAACTAWSAACGPLEDRRGVVPKGTIYVRAETNRAHQGVDNG